MREYELLRKLAGRFRRGEFFVLLGRFYTFRLVFGYVHGICQRLGRPPETQVLAASLESTLFPDLSIPDSARQRTSALVSTLQASSRPSALT